MLSIQAEEFESFLWKYYKNEINVLALQYPDEKSLYIDFFKLDNFSNNLADLFLENPDLLLDDFEHVIRDFDSMTGTTLDKAHLRIIRLPKKRKVKDIRIEDVGKLVSIEGLVLTASEVRPQIVVAAFECPFCGHIFSVVQSGSQFKEPIECEQETGGCGKKSQHFKLLREKSKLVNAQHVELQDPHEELRGGELPQTLNVSLMDDITGVVFPGNRIVTTGILRAYQIITRGGRTTSFGIYLDANSIEKPEREFEERTITEEDEREIKKLSQQPGIYELLMRSIAPSIYGYDEIKEALLLQQFGGEPINLPDGTRRRGDIHILLVGDPGVAKSDLLYFSSRLAPRGVYTDGTGASGAGLTAAASKDKDGMWILRGGALVLADKGIAAVDEIEKMNKEDREKMHGAMEQQKIAIDKAGIHARLNSRCAVLAAANPKYGRFDEYTAISEQINMPPALLSRFDLIFTMMDRQSEETDVAIATHILNSYDTEAENALVPPISPKFMRKYIAFSKRRKPRLSSEAKGKFNELYIGLRRQGYEDKDVPVPITVRQLEALVRLGQARARSRLSDVVTAEDADRVIDLVMTCLKRVFVDPETGRLDVDWVTVGTTKTRRDRARSIREIIKELEKGYGEEVPIEEVLDLAEEQGMDREKAEDVIEVMKRDGILLSPESGVIKFVR